jgi:hypothetical protein
MAGGSGSATAATAGMAATVRRATWLAEELEQLLEAGDWTEAHAVLCRAVAPSLMYSGRCPSLRELLARLEPHATQVERTAGPTAWLLGGGLYIAYLDLKVGLEIAFA